MPREEPLTWSRPCSPGLQRSRGSCPLPFAGRTRATLCLGGLWRSVAGSAAGGGLRPGLLPAGSCVCATRDSAGGLGLNLSCRVGPLLTRLPSGGSGARASPGGGGPPEGRAFPRCWGRARPAAASGQARAGAAEGRPGACPAPARFLRSRSTDNTVLRSHTVLGKEIRKVGSGPDALSGPAAHRTAPTARLFGRPPFLLRSPVCPGQEDTVCCPNPLGRSARAPLGTGAVLLLGRGACAPPLLGPQLQMNKPAPILAPQDALP